MCHPPHAIIAANGAKVPHLDNRHGRRESRQYQPPIIEDVEELMQEKFERFDPKPPVPTTPATDEDSNLPPQEAAAAGQDVICVLCAEVRICEHN